MHLRKICLTAVCIAIMLSIAAAICFLVSISPPKDEVVSIPYPPEFFCASAENRIDYQIDGKCAAYAAAYLLRYFGEEADGEALFPELKRPLGFVSANSIADVFAQHGYQAEAFHGNVGTLKQRLVVFFSRMGYVKKAAYEEADRTGACVYELKATERTEGTLGFWWCGRFAMHRWDMPIVPVGIDLSKYQHITICYPIWVFSLAPPVRSFCRAAAGKIKEADCISVHHTAGGYKNTAREMDAILQLKHTGYRSISCKMGVFSPMEAAKQEEMK